MDIGSLLDRLQAAERAMVVFGWCPVGASDREEAALELWHRWANLVPPGFLDRAAHPDIDLEELKRVRLERREQTLARYGLGS